MAEYCLTDIKVVEAVFTWTIKNFSKCDKKNQEALFTREFTKPGTQYRWEIEIYGHGLYEEDEDWICINLQLVANPHEQPLLANHKFIFQDKDEKELIYLDYTEFPSEYNTIQKRCTDRFRGTEKIVKRDILIPQLKDDILVVKCLVKWNIEEPIMIRQVTSILDKQNIQNRLSSTLSKLLNSGNLNDITLEVSDGTEFHAHKCLLAAHSPVFAAMFEHKMNETQNSKVIIKDLDAETVKCMLEFIYSGKFEAKTWDMEKLFAAADKYAIDYLKELCEQELCNQINIQNAVYFLSFADQRNVKSLKVKVDEFISSNWSVLIETDDIKNLLLTQPILLFGVLERLKN